MWSEIRRFRRLCGLFMLFVFSRPDSVDSGRSVNYCGAKMCDHTDLHTFCQFTDGPGPRCVGYMDAPLSVEEKARILNRMNQRRAAAAAGRLRGFPSASNMLKLRWVEELSREAQMWADQCASPSTPEEHDTCRHLFSVSVGQLVASVVGEAPGLRVESLVDVWYMQSMLYRGNISAYQPPSESSAYYGDFAQMLWAHSYLVGCGRSRFMVMPPHGRMRSVERLVCNIAPQGPPIGRPIWSDGGPAAGCPPRARPDITSPQLCAYQQTFDDSFDGDDSITIQENILLDTILTIERDQSLDKIGGIDDLYLTRIAIANLQVDTSSEIYNSLQKRDILNIPRNSPDMVELVDLNELIEATKKSDDIRITATDMNIQNKEIKKEIKATTKVSTVGRPKSYNVEELNDDREVQVDQYVNDIPIHDQSDKSKEFYADYEYNDNIEETSEATLTTYTYGVETARAENMLSLTKTRTTVELTTVPERDEILSSRNMESKMANVTAKVEIDVKFSGFIGAKGTNFSALFRYLNETAANESVDTKAIEDYLSDPETVRQLQEELDRMERDLSLSTTNEGPAGKSRRELRKFEATQSADETQSLTDLLHTTDVSPIDSSETDRKVEEILSNETEPEETGNNTNLRSAPMLNMVLKYMPYLRGYEKTIMKGTQNGAFRTTSSYTSLVLPLLYLY